MRAASALAAGETSLRGRAGARFAAGASGSGATPTCVSKVLALRTVPAVPNVQKVPGHTGRWHCCVTQLTLRRRAKKAGFYGIFGRQHGRVMK